MTDENRETEGTRRLTRRALLRDASIAGAAGVGLGFGLGRWTEDQPASSTRPSGAVPFFGPHQAGIATPPPPRLVLTAFDVTRGNAADLAELMQAWTRAASQMAEGRPADVSDSGEVVGLGPSGLTLTFGVGPSLFDDRFGLAAKGPPGLAPLPPFPGEALQDSMSGGDLILQACAEDHQVAYHAVRQLARIGAGTVKPRWQQVGFRSETTETPRNLLGFKDGTVNPVAATPAFASTVWVDRGWMAGGTYLCVRRIQIDLDKWDAQTTPDQQIVIGRDKDTGAPLSGGTERSPLDLAAVGRDGAPAIPTDSHIRLAAPQSNGGAQILRRGYSFDDGIDPVSGTADAGTIFLAFVADIQGQFVPIQSRLAASDRLNAFTTAVGSATFAVLPGVSPGDHLGRSLLS